MVPSFVCHSETPIAIDIHANHIDIITNTWRACWKCQRPLAAKLEEAKDSERRFQREERWRTAIKEKQKESCKPACMGDKDNRAINSPEDIELYVSLVHALGLVLALPEKGQERYLL
jgi:hypothetical protein